MAVINDLDSLETYALERGAFRAKVFPAKDVVVDPRVRAKCEIPLCPHYGHCLTCPPNVMSVDDFQNVLERFETAIMIQTRSSITGNFGEADKKEVLKYIASLHIKKYSVDGGNEVVTALNDMKLAEINLHKLVNDVESEAMKLGYHYATGLIGGRCLLCEECVEPGSAEKCRAPYEARPSMEAVGVDVVRTAKNAGLPFDLPPKKEVIWSGLVLVE